MIEVLATGCWDCAKGNNVGQGGCDGQVTKCRYKGYLFYVRENVNSIPSFLISSGERWGDKGYSKPRPARQSLELYAHPPLWDEIAVLVKEHEEEYTRLCGNGDKRKWDDNGTLIISSL